MKNIYFCTIAALAFGLAAVAAPTIPKTIGEFNIEEDGSNLEYDVTPLVTAAGTYEVTVQYTKGKNAVGIKSAALSKDGTEILRDEHEGSSGMLSNNNSYYLKYKDFAPGGTYKLKLAVNGMGGDDSSGKVILKRLPLLDPVGKWNKENMAGGGEYDITGIVPKSGKFEVTFLYTHGPHAAGIRSVAVMADGKEIARDAHKGQTGSFNSANVYKFAVPFKAGTKYILKVDFDPKNDRGADSDSNGNIWLSEAN